MYRLIFLNGRLKGRRVAVQQGNLLIGRDASCQIDVQEDDEISRQHALLEQRADGVWVRDLGAMNKTEVNGVPVDEALLKHGDILEVGRTQFEFQLMETPVARQGSRRRFSGVQFLTVAAIVAVFVLQGLFMFLQVFQGSKVKTSAPRVEAETAELEPELQRALDLRVAESNVSGVVQATNAPTSVKDEVAELRSAVADLRGQIDEVAPPVEEPAKETPPVEDVPPARPAQPDVVETPFPVREQPPPLVEVPAPPPARPEVDDPLIVRAKELLETARAEIVKSNLVAADQMLERIQVMSPDFIPAYVERAGLYEKRAMLNKAGEQWALVMERSKGTPMYATATAERQRLAQAEVTITTTRRHLDERPVSQQLPRLVRIASIDRERFPGNKEYDEMRLVRVNLKPRSSEGSLSDGSVEVKVSFYDRVIATGEVVPARATTPEEPMMVEGPWPAGAARSVTATYILKRGFRQEEEKVTGQKRMYEGFRAQVFYRGELQDEDAQPKTLLKVETPEPKADANAPVPMR